MFFFLNYIFSIISLNFSANNKFIIETLQLDRSLKKGEALLKMNCVGCQEIIARGLVGPDLQSITQRINDKEIIKKVAGGLTTPMPSFEIDPVNMSHLLRCLHGFK